MKKLLGLRALAAVAVVAAAVGSIAGGFSATAGAAGTSPPWETTGSNYDSVGGLLFYNSSGTQVTGGSLSTAPIAAYVEGTSTVRLGDTKATLYAYTPVIGVAPGNWQGQPLSASTTFPNASAPSPLNTATLPVVTGNSLDESLSEYISNFPNNDSSSDGYAGIYQLRLKTTASGKSGNSTYDSADILVSGSTWSVVYPTQVTTTSVAASPSGSAAFGAPVQLTATITPSNSTGTVQFLNGTAAIGSPVTVSGGTASLTTSAIGAGNDNVYAVYTPDATSAGNGYSPSTGSTPLVVTATTTTLTTTQASPVAAGTSVQLHASVAVTPTTSVAASGTVQFEYGTTPIGNPVTLSGGTASTTTSALPAGDLTLNAVFTSTNSAEGGSTGSTAFVVQGTTTTLTTSPATTAVAGTPVQLNASVSVTPGSAPAASGTVQFENGTTP
ncbi:MAG: Ig-like domain-containing protein, partial [Acidimicrobiales bacterium]